MGLFRDRAIYDTTTARNVAAWRDHVRLPPRGLRLADAYTVARETPGARLVHADPPWQYRNSGTSGGFNGAAGGVYECATPATIVRDLNAAFDSAAPDAYLLLWITWPILVEEITKAPGILRSVAWRAVSGGSIHKDTGIGIGFHWRGDSEPLLLLTKGKPKPITKGGRNAYQGARARHSEKPEPYLRALLEAFTAPGDLVLDLYAGLAPMRRAALAAGRAYVGAEIDPERHAAALASV